MYEYFSGILAPRGHELLIAGGTEDHVHLLFSMARDGRITDIVRDTKAISCKWVHEVIPHRRAFAWQAGYSAFSVSHSALAGVKKYIANQKEHHRTRTFQEELLALLQKHEIQYDDRYLWD